MAVPPAHFRVSSQRPFALNVMSVANDKDDNEMILGAEHRSHGICLTAEENPGIPQLGYPSMFYHKLREGKVKTLTRN